MPSLAAADESPPTYNGDMSFRIDEASGPEEFTWRIEVGPRQTLEEISDQQALVLNQGGFTAVEIDAEKAHDVDGTSVPTSLRVTQPDQITLTVHHREGDPENGGAPFAYPILSGPGFEFGYRAAEILLPPSPPGSAVDGPPPAESVVAAMARKKACGAVVNPYPGTRYEGVPLSGIESMGVSCSTARLIARRAHRKALGLPVPVSGVRHFDWHGWKVRGDLRPSSDVYAARRDGMLVSWRF
jgi:hypothetical protein